MGPSCITTKIWLSLWLLLTLAALARGIPVPQENDESSGPVSLSLSLSLHLYTYTYTLSSLSSVQCSAHECTLTRTREFAQRPVFFFFRRPIHSLRDRIIYIPAACAFSVSALIGDLIFAELRRSMVIADKRFVDGTRGGAIVLLWDTLTPSATAAASKNEYIREIRARIDVRLNILIGWYTQGSDMYPCYLSQFISINTATSINMRSTCDRRWQRPDHLI